MATHTVKFGAFTPKLTHTVGKTRTRKLPVASEVQDFMQVIGAGRFTLPIPTTRRV